MADSESIKEIVNQAAVQAATAIMMFIQVHRNRAPASHSTKPVGKSKAEEWITDTGETKV